MKKIIPQAIIYSFLILLSGCITPKAVSNNFVYSDYKKLENLHLTLMPFIANELSNSELDEITEDIVDNLVKHPNVKQIILPVQNEEDLFNGKKFQTMQKISYYSTNRVINKLISKDLESRWNLTWDNYLNKKELDKDILIRIGNITDANAIFQFAVTDIIKIRPIHRKVIAETTVKIKYALFLLDGTILLEGESIAKESNAWSGQLTPRLFDVIDVAVSDIFENFNFNKNY